MNTNILPLILETTKKRVNILKKNREGLWSLVKKAPPLRSFKDAISKKDKIAIIAEIKQASPSAGIIRKDFNHIELASRLQQGGVDALSVLTEEEFFLGKLMYLEDIRNVVDLPLLRKDFIIDESQVLESRAAGSDAILLIVRLLTDEQLSRLFSLAKELGLDVIVEVHTEKELKRAIKISPDIIGINNRNLSTLKVDVSRTQMLVPFVPCDCVIISESGIKELKDILLLKGLGVNAVLIGESIMREDNIEKKLELLNIDGKS